MKNGVFIPKKSDDKTTQRIKLLAKDEINIKEFSKKIWPNINQPDVRMNAILIGERRTYQNISDIANYFNVSYEYLMGLTDDKNKKPTNTKLSKTGLDDLSISILSELFDGNNDNVLNDIIHSNDFKILIITLSQYMKYGTGANDKYVVSIPYNNKTKNKTLEDLTYHNKSSYKHSSYDIEASYQLKIMKIIESIKYDDNLYSKFYEWI